MDIASLAIQINTSDVSRAETELDKLGQKGAKAEQAAKGLGESYKRATDQIGSMAGAASKAGEAMHLAGLSAGQYQQAMRMLPMQLTDVVTSLASGMPLWMVAIQQGGQVRDSFGGIGNAARAVVGAIGPMNLALGSAAAAAAALVLAYERGRGELERLNQALIMTGNSAGLTSDHLAMLARQMDMMSGVTISSATDALVTVAETGRFTGEQISLVATAAEQMRDATGRSVDETVKEFLRLRSDPVKALLDLNEQYHFLSESQLEQIESLQDQGKQQAAATEAMRLYANVIAERTPQITENLNWIEKGWRAIQRGASETIDDILGIGRELTAYERINDLLQKRNTLIANQDRILMSDSQRKANQDQIDAYNAEIKALQNAEVERQKRISSGAAEGALDSERRRAAEEWERGALRYASDRKKLEEEIKKIRIDGLKAGIAQPEIDARIAAATKEFEERQAKANRPRAYTDDAATRMLQGLRDQEASLRAQLESTVTLSTAQRAQVEWAQQLADLKNKSILTADQKSLLANQEAVTAQLAKNAALDDELRKQEERAELAERIAKVDEASWSDASRALYAYQQQVETLQAGVVAGVISEEQRDRIVAGLDEQAAAAEKSADQMTVFMDEAARNIQGAFADFLFDPFSEGLDGMAIGFAKVVQRMAAEAAAAQLANQLFGVADAGGSRSGGLLQSGLSAISGLFANANGNAFAAGNVIPFAKGAAFTNSIVDTPTLFPFAKGTGLMGEAGPEAIMPLTRAADGSLGVRAMGGGSGASINVVVNIQSDGSVTTQTNSQAGQQFGAEIGRFVEQRYRQLLARDLRADGAIGRHLSGRG